MTDTQYILVVNGASSSEDAPNFISIIRRNGKEYQTIIERKTNLKGGPERFPIYFQEFVQKGFIQPQQINLIAIIVGPGSFTGLRASIAFVLGIGLGLECPVIGLHRGEALFHALIAAQKVQPLQSIWHITHARRGRVFIENSEDQKVIAYNEADIPVPEHNVILCGEAANLIDNQHHCQISDYYEADAVMISECAYQYWQLGQQSNEIYPLYVDPPEAKLPAKGLRDAPK